MQTVNTISSMILPAIPVSQVINSIDRLGGGLRSASGGYAAAVLTIGIRQTVPRTVHRWDEEAGVHHVHGQSIAVA